jgi:hypothetical protein
VFSFQSESFGLISCNPEIGQPAFQKNIRGFILIRPSANFSLREAGIKREVGRAVPARRGIRGRLGTAVPTFFFLMEAASSGERLANA